MTRPGLTADAVPVPEPSGAAHRKFIDTLQELGGVLWEMDAQSWKFTFVSDRAERLFGYPVARWLGQDGFWQDTLVHPDDRQWCVSYCSTASGECRNHAFLYRAVTADGRILWVKDVVRVIPDADGRAAVMRGVMIDASDEMAAGVRSGEIDFDAPDLGRLRDILAA